MVLAPVDVMPVIGRMFCCDMVLIVPASGMLLLLSLSQVGKHYSSIESGTCIGVKLFDCFG